MLEGLEGASTAAGHAFDRKKMDETLSGLGNRVFVMNDVHEDQPVVFQTRWTLSYLRGPLTREQIQTLMAARKPMSAHTGQSDTDSASPTAQPTGPASTSSPSPTTSATSSMLGPSCRRMSLSSSCRAAPHRPGESLLYRPALLGVARLHYTEKKTGVDYWETLALLRGIDEEMPAEPWDASEPFDEGVPELDKTPEAVVFPLTRRDGSSQELRGMDQNSQELSLPRTDVACVELSCAERMVPARGE